jgi:hypothetical protein
MYTQPRVSEYLKCATKDQVLTQKISKEKQERFPMKALLRSSIFALFVFAGYAAVATDITKPHSNANIPQPCQGMPPHAMCQVGK